jgi:hypothetical protein
VECNRMFSSEDLKKHVLQHKKSYDSTVTFGGHTKRNSDKKPFGCDVPGCSYSGKQRKNLKHHKINIHGKGLECQMCGNIYNVKHLKKHLLRHETGKKGLLRCVSHKGCNKTFFTSPSDLKTHNMLMHKQRRNRIVDLMFARDASEQSLEVQNNENLESAVEATKQVEVEKVPDCDYPNVKDEIEEVVFD